MKVGIISLGLCLLCGLGVFFLYDKRFNPSGISAAEKEAAYHQLLGREAVLTPMDRTHFSTYDGRYVSFLYPSWTSVMQDQNPLATQGGVLLESFHFTDVRFHLSGQVSVFQRTGMTTITSDPAVMARLHDSRYNVLGQSTVKISFKKSPPDGELSQFLLTHEKVYALVITANNEEKMQDWMDRIEGSMSTH